MTESQLPRLLEDVVKGDAGQIAYLAKASHAQLRSAWAASSRPVVTAEAAKAVLRALGAGRISVADAALWSQLIRRGYLARGSERISPLNIEWEPADEDKVADLAGAMETFEDDDLMPSAELLAELMAD
jgi:predicted deacylase